MFEGLFRPMHLLVILFIVLIIFGPGKLPEIGEGLGKSIRSFKKAMTEKDDLKEEHASIEQKEKTNA
jgi:sec-independent protein translocase protein TatA